MKILTTVRKLTIALFIASLYACNSGGGSNDDNDTSSTPGSSACVLGSSTIGSCTLD